MQNVAENTHERPSTPPPASGRVPKESFEERVARVYSQQRGTSLASVVNSATETLRLVIVAIDGDPDRNVSDGMISRMLEVTELLDAARDELTTVHDDEFAIAVRYAGVSERARLMGLALVNNGEKYDRFTWTALLMHLDATVLSEGAMESMRTVGRRTAERGDSASGVQQVGATAPEAEEEANEDDEATGDEQDDESACLPRLGSGDLHIMSEDLVDLNLAVRDLETMVDGTSSEVRALIKSAEHAFSSSMQFVSSYRRGLLAFERAEQARREAQS